MEEKTIDINTLFNDHSTGDENQHGTTETLTTFQNLNDSEINAILPTDDDLFDDLFIELEPETPLEGSRLPFKLVDCQITKNQLTDFGVKTMVRVKLSCFWGDEKNTPVYEKFYINPGEPINGRLKAFCQDLFGAFNLKSANLKDLVGCEGTAVISYTLGKDGVTLWPHLSQFKPLS